MCACDWAANVWKWISTEPGWIAGIGGWVLDALNGPVGGAIVALVGIRMTQRATKQDKTLDRAAAVEDKLRTEVAELLSMRKRTTDLQRNLSTSYQGLLKAGQSGGESDSELDKRFDAITDLRDEYIEYIEGIRARVTRISFLTHDVALTEALNLLRTYTYGEWSLPISKKLKDDLPGAPSWAAWWSGLQTLISSTQEAFDKVEEATRDVVTKVGTPQPVKSRRLFGTRRPDSQPASGGPDNGAG